jgi:hypothetical protein
MSMSIVPRPFHRCRFFPSDNLVTVDGTPLPLAEISRRRSVLIAALDLDMGTPSAGQILSQLLLPVYGRPRQGSGSDSSGGGSTEDLHQLLLCCDAYIIILTKEPLSQCRQLQRELAAAAASLCPSAAQPQPPLLVEGGAAPQGDPGASAADGAHLLPGCLAIVHDEGAELLRSLQLVGLDGRTVPAVFSIASHERLAVHDSALHDDDGGGGGGGGGGGDESEEAAVSLDRQSLALHHRQFGLAYAGMQPTLE